MINLLEEYKNISIELLKELKSDNIDLVFELSAKREVVLHKLSLIPSDKSMDLERDFKLISLENEINDEINKQKVSIKKEMEENKRKKAANAVYGRQFENIYFVNKQI